MGGPATPGILLVFSVLMEVPIAMIFLSLVLPVRATRWVSTLAVALTTLYVIGGGSATYSYVFFATLEAVSMGAILGYVWRLGKTTSSG